MKGSVEVSRYAVATTLIFYAYLLPTVLYNYFLPKLATVFKKKRKVSYLHRQFMALTILLTLPFVVFLFTFSKEILGFIYTCKYVDSQYILKILAVVFFFHSLCFVFGAVITASGNQSLRSKIQILAATANILLNIIFIPLYGAEGAAFTTAMTEVIIFYLYWYFSRKLTYKGIYK
jgi:O-antigen/teichoic acid export membrane protein